MSIETIRECLKFLEYEFGDQDRCIDKSGLSEAVNPPINQGGGIEEHRPDPSDLTSKLDVREDDSKIVLGGQHHGDGEVADHQCQYGLRDAEIDRSLAIRTAHCIDDRIDEKANGDGGDESEADAHINTDHGGEPFVRGHRVEHDDDRPDRRTGQEHPEEGLELEFLRTGGPSGDGEHRDGDQQNQKEEPDHKEEKSM